MNGGASIEWDVMLTWMDGLWRATAVGPRGGQRMVNMSVSCADIDGAKRLLRAMLWLKMSATTGIA